MEGRPKARRWRRAVTFEKKNLPSASRDTGLHGSKSIDIDIKKNLKGLGPIQKVGVTKTVTKTVFGRLTAAIRPHIQHTSQAYVSYPRIISNSSLVYFTCLALMDRDDEEADQRQRPRGLELIRSRRSNLYVSWNPIFISNILNMS